MSLWIQTIQLYARPATLSNQIPQLHFTNVWFLQWQQKMFEQDLNSLICAQSHIIQKAEQPLQTQSMLYVVSTKTQSSIALGKWETLGFKESSKISEMSYRSQIRTVELTLRRDTLKCIFVLTWWSTIQKLLGKVSSFRISSAIQTLEHTLPTTQLV